MDMMIKSVHALQNLNVSYLRNGIYKQGHVDVWKRLKFYVSMDMMNKTVNVLISLNANYLNNGILKLILVSASIEN